MSILGYGPTRRNDDRRKGEAEDAEEQEGDDRAEIRGPTSQRYRLGLMITHFVRRGSCKYRHTLPYTPTSSLLGRSSPNGGRKTHHSFYIAPTELDEADVRRYRINSLSLFFSWNATITNVQHLPHGNAIL